MAFESYDWRELRDNTFGLIAEEWMLIGAGKEGSWNTMTASWGGFGQLWNRDVVFVFVRPTRYTFEFMEREPVFGLSFLGEEGRKALQVCGAVSGRSADKAKAAGITPRFFELPEGGSLPGFEEARLVLGARKLYATDIEPGRFLDPRLESHYPKKDYHRLYIGALEAAWKRS